MSERKEMPEIQLAPLADLQRQVSALTENMTHLQAGHDHLRGSIENLFAMLQRLGADDGD